MHFKLLFFATCLLVIIRGVLALSIPVDASKPAPTLLEEIEDEIKRLQKHSKHHDAFKTPLSLPIPVVLPREFAELDELYERTGALAHSQHRDALNAQHAAAHTAAHTAHENARVLHNAAHEAHSSAADLHLHHANTAGHADVKQMHLKAAAEHRATAGHHLVQSKHHENEVKIHKWQATLDHDHRHAFTHLAASSTHKAHLSSKAANASHKLGDAAKQHLNALSAHQRAGTEHHLLGKAHAITGNRDGAHASLSKSSQHQHQADIHRSSALSLMPSQHPGGLQQKGAKWGAIHASGSAIKANKSADRAHRERTNMKTSTGARPIGKPFGPRPMPGARVQG